MQTPFEVNIDPYSLPELEPETPKPTIGDMTQEDFARNLAGLLLAVLENFSTATQKPEITPVWGTGGGGGGTSDGVVLLN